MKFLTAAWSVIVATITSVVDQAIVSPTPGQVFPANEPFNLTYASHRYFKESSVKISVITAPVGGTFPGARFTPSWSSPSHFHYGDMTGNHTVYVIETYNAFGGLPGIDMVAVPVTFV
ncbi:hypothetical protein B0H19DRAFT_1191678 [Mycena capillaripes]|nr:hypothetical protein B0H19DRAFT_1191678 [Mycena capillaripes]